MGVMHRAEAREEQKRIRNKFAATVVIAAAIIAAVRLARDENIRNPTERLNGVVGDSVGLAWLILERVLR
jgi:hypothetical protein